MSDLVAKGPVGEKRNVARGREQGREGVLQVDEQGLGAGRKEGEEVDGSFDLEGRTEGLAFSVCWVENWGERMRKGKTHSG